MEAAVKYAQLWAVSVSPVPPPHPGPAPFQPLAPYYLVPPCPAPLPRCLLSCPRVMRAANTTMDQRILVGIQEQWVAL